MSCGVSVFPLSLFGSASRLLQSQFKVLASASSVSYLTSSRCRPGELRMLSVNLMLQTPGLRWDIKKRKKKVFLNDIPNYTLFHFTNKNSLVVSRMDHVHHNFDSEYWGWTGSLNNFPVYALLFQFNASIWQTQKLYLLMPGHDQNL